MLRLYSVLRRYRPVFSGEAIHWESMFSALIERGVRPVVLSQGQGNLPEKEIVKDVMVRRFWGIGSGMRCEFTWTYELCKYLVATRHDFDVLLLHSCGVFSFLLLLVAKILGKGTVLRMTLLDSDDPVTVSQRKMGGVQNLAFRLADRVVSLSTPLTSRYRQVFGNTRKIRLIPQGVNTARFYPVSPQNKLVLRRKLGLSEGDEFICFVGSIIARKGVDILVDAFLHLADQLPELNLLLVGPLDGSEPGHHAFVQDLQSRIRHAGLTTRVRFLGKVENVPEYLQASDLFVFPSAREGLPSALVEAMAVGLPCIVSHIEGITEDLISQGENGIIVYSARYDDYAKYIQQLFSHPDDATVMGRQARTTVEQGYSVEIIAAKNLSVFREVLVR